MSVCVYTNSEADSFEIVQAVQSLLGLGQVLGKLGMQQPHGERHHGAWTGGREGGWERGKRKQERDGEGGNKKEGGMRTEQEREREKREGRQRETERQRVRDENIKPSTHTQTAHSPEGRNLQMALSYVWLLIKPSHLALSAAQLHHSSFSLIPLSLSASASFTLPQTHTYTHTHTSPRKSLYSGESPGFDQGLFDTVITSEVQLAGPSSTAASASLCISICISLVCLCFLSHPSTVQNKYSFSPFTSVSLLLPSVTSFYCHG